MNEHLIKLIVASGLGLAVSLGLAWNSERLNKSKKAHKLKEESWRAVLEDIKKSLDHVSPNRVDGLDTITIRLRGFLELYVDEHPSQSVYLKPLIQRLENLASQEYSYKQQISQLRKIIGELERPIN